MPWKDRYTISNERSAWSTRTSAGPRESAAPSTLSSTSASPADRKASLPATSEARRRHSERARGSILWRRSPSTGSRRHSPCRPSLPRSIRPGSRRSSSAHEVAAHGLKHEDVSGLSREEEKARLDLATEILTKITGRRPVGWFSCRDRRDPFAGGTISPNTMDLLIEAGYAYMGNGLADDIPHYWVTDFASWRAILTLPYYYHFDDQFFSMFLQGTGLENSDMLFRNWRAELDAQYKRGRFFTMTLHPAAHRLVQPYVWPRGLSRPYGRACPTCGIRRASNAPLLVGNLSGCFNARARAQHLEGLPRQLELSRREREEPPLPVAPHRSYARSRKRST